MPTVIYIFIAPEARATRKMWLLFGMALFLPVPYLYDTKPWFKFRLKVIGREFIHGIILLSPVLHLLLMVDIHELPDDSAIPGATL